jgi:hypothetical protein
MPPEICYTCRFWNLGLCCLYVPSTHPGSLRKTPDGPKCFRWRPRDEEPQDEAKDAKGETTDG